MSTSYALMTAMIPGRFVLLSTSDHLICEFTIKQLTLSAHDAMVFVRLSICLFGWDWRAL